MSLHRNRQQAIAPLPPSASAGSQKHEEVARWAADGGRSPAFRAMAEHLGGAALKAYEHALVAVKEQWAEAEAAQAQAEAKL